MPFKPCSNNNQTFNLGNSRVDNCHFALLPPENFKPRLKKAVSFASGKRMFSSQIAKDFAFSEIVRDAVFLLDVNWDIACGVVINATPFV